MFKKPVKYITINSMDKVFIDDLFYPPIENFTVCYQKNKTNLLLVYPYIPNIEIDSLSSIKGKIFIDDKLVNSEEEFKSLQDNFFNIDSSYNCEVFKDSVYLSLLNYYLELNNYLKRKYSSQSELNNLDEKRFEIEQKQAEIKQEYDDKILKLDNQVEEELSTLRKKNSENKLDTSENNLAYHSGIQAILAKKEERKNEIESEYLSKLDELKKVNQQYFLDSKSSQATIKKQIKQEYKLAKKELKSKIKQLKKENLDSLDYKENLDKAYNEFYLKTFVPKKVAVMRLNRLFEDFSFQISYSLKNKMINKFSLIELMKIKMIFGIISTKQVFNLNLLDDNLTSQDKLVLIEDFKKLTSYENKFGLIITNDVEHANLVSDESSVFFALEGKTIEYSSKANMISNCLVPIVQKFFKKENILQDDIDFAMDIKGNLVEILPEHYIYASSSQVVAYTRLIKYEKRMEKKQVEIKKQKVAELTNNKEENSKKVIAKKPIKKKIVKQTIQESINDIVLVNKLDKLKKDNKEDKIKVYIIEKREKDNMWVIHLDNSSKALKLFKTKALALEYGKTLTYNQVAKLIVIPSKIKSIDENSIINKEENL